MGDVDVPDEVREQLLTAGATDDEIDRVTDEQALFTLAGDVVRRRGIEWMTVEAVAAAAGVSVQEVERFRLLVGLPASDGLVPHWTLSDLESYRVAAAYAGDEVAREYIRVIAAAAANVAAAATAMALNEVTPRLHEMDLPPTEALELIDAMVTEMVVRTPNAWGHLFRQHLLVSARQGRAVHEAELSRLAIAFVDLTGSTLWAEQVSNAVHAAALSRFEEAAWSSATGRGGRLVKLIGDEAMVIATGPRQAVLAAADICKMAAADPDLPPARGAVGYGSVYARGGDYFGPLVNLIARAVKEAQPDQLLLSPEVAASLDGSEFRLASARRHILRGVDHPVDLIPLEVSGPKDPPR